MWNLLKFVLINPIPSSDLRNLRTLRQKLIILVRVCILFANISSILIYVVALGCLMFGQAFNITHFILGFLSFIQVITGIVKHLVIMSNAEKLSKVLKATSHSYCPKDQEKFNVKSVHKTFKIYCRYSVILFSVNFMLYMVGTALRIISKHFELIDNTILATSNAALYSLIFIMTIYAPILVLFVNLICDFFIYGLIACLSIEFKVLAYNFEHLTEDVNRKRRQQLLDAQERLKKSQNSKNDSTISSCCSSSNKTEPYSSNSSILTSIKLDDLKPLIDRHNELFECHKILQESFSIVFLVNFIIAAFVICIISFRLTISSFDRTYFVFILIRDLFKIFFQCYFGQMIKDASFDVLDGVTKIEWEDIEDQAVRKSLTMIMIRSQEPATFLIMKVSEITLEGFTAILASAYSYYTLCLQLYGGN